jgi:NAD(P)-dependent dehydrogenase (short-subunit alcohol dehydrogenase family)
VGRRVWLITGASSGLGRALAEAALAAGDTVAAAVRRPDSVADLLAAAPDRATSIPLDVAAVDDARAAAAVAAVLDRYGRLDVLVNNAGMALLGAAEEISDAELRELMNLHFFGPVALARAALPQMRSQRSGAIVQMSSQGGRRSVPSLAAYSATKFALEGWSEALAAEVAPLGIQVLIVEPGAFRTNVNAPGAQRFASPKSAYDQQMAPRREVIAKHHGTQPGDPAKAAQAVRDALDSDPAPLRLVLGNDAADNILGSLERSRSELLAWEAVSRGTDF